MEYNNNFGGKSLTRLLSEKTFASYPLSRDVYKAILPKFIQSKHCTLVEKIVRLVPEVINEMVNGKTIYQLVVETQDLNFSIKIDEIANQNEKILLPANIFPIAAERYKDEIFKQILTRKYPADMLNYTNIYGESALFIAAKKGYTEKVEALLAQPGIDPVAQRHDGETAMSIAARKWSKHTDICALFRTKDTREKIIFTYIAQNKIKFAVKSLQEYYKNFKGEAFIELLSTIAKKAPVHLVGIAKGLLYNAVKGGNNNFVIINILKQVPVLLNHPLSQGRTILHHAVAMNNFDLVEKLTGFNDIDLNAKTTKPFNDNSGYQGMTAAHLAIWSSSKSGADNKILQHLIQKGADVTIPNKNNTTPLMAAAKTDNVGAINLLKEKKIDASCVDAYGNTALTYAVKYVSLEAIKAISAISTKATLNYKNKKGESALFIAAEKGYKEEVKFLLAQHGIDVVAGKPSKLAGCKFTTARDIARHNNHNSVVTLFDQPENLKKRLKQLRSLDNSNWYLDKEVSILAAIYKQLDINVSADVAKFCKFIDNDVAWSLLLKISKEFIDFSQVPVTILQKIFIEDKNTLRWVVDNPVNFNVVSKKFNEIGIDFLHHCRRHIDISNLFGQLSDSDKHAWLKEYIIPALLKDKDDSNYYYYSSRPKEPFIAARWQFLCNKDSKRAILSALKTMQFPANFDLNKLVKNDNQLGALVNCQRNIIRDDQVVERGITYTSQEVIRHIIDQPKCSSGIAEGASLFRAGANAAAPKSSGAPAYLVSDCLKFHR